MPTVHDLLPAGGRPALERAQAQPLSYAVRYLFAPGPKPRVLVILGEAHMKLGTASEIGRQVVSRFELRGVETFQRRHVFAGRLLGVLIQFPRTLLRIVTVNTVRGSTITDAKELGSGHTCELERTDKVPLSLHVGSAYLSVVFAVFWSFVLLGVLGMDPPWLRVLLVALEAHMLMLVPAYFLRAHSWAWVIQPVIAILSTRDTLMAEGTVRMLREHPEPSAAVVVMGRAHVNGYERELVLKHGFERAQLV